MPDRRYDEKEVTSLIKRAAELQGEATDDDPDRPTLGQVQQAAAELGIQPEFLARAAAEMSRAPKRRGIFGGPFRTHRSVTLPGRLTPDRWPLALQRMRDAADRVGTPNQIGEAFEWTSHNPDGLHVSITPDGNVTRVSIQSEISGWAVLFLLIPSIFLGPLIAGMVAALGYIGWAVALGIYALVFLGGRRKLCQIADHRSLQIDQLVQTIESELVLTAEPPALSPLAQERKNEEVNRSRT